MTRDAEDLLRDVMSDPAYDVTPDGDPLAPVWRKARAIRRRRTLAAGGTAVVVIAAAAITGIAITGQTAKGGPAVLVQPSGSTSVAPPSLAPTSAAVEPTPSATPSSVPPVQTTFKHMAVHLENPVSNGYLVGGSETSEGGESFRGVVLESNGTVLRSEWVPGHVGGTAFGPNGLFMTVKGSNQVRVLSTIDPGFSPAATIPLGTITDPNGSLSGPIAGGGDGVWVADRRGITSLGADGTVGASLPHAPARVCQLVTALGGVYVVGGPLGGACIQATYVNSVTGTSTDVADAQDSALGLDGLVADGDGFWVEQPSGTMGAYEHVHFVPSSGQPPVVAPRTIGGSNGMQLSIADGHAWISDPGTLQCADSSGRVLWHTDLPADAGAAHVFATPGGAVLVTNTYAEPFDTSVCH